MINRVVLVGRLVKDVEVKKTTNGLSTTTFTLAVDRNGKKEEGKQNADFPQVVAWRQAADFLGQYAKKGAVVGVDGRIQTRTYDKDGQTVYVTEVVAETVRLIGGGNGKPQEVTDQVVEEVVELTPESEDLPF